MLFLTAMIPFFTQEGVLSEIRAHQHGAKKRMLVHLQSIATCICFSFAVQSER